MGSPQTLHDFVLDLLTDPDARSAFELDPEGALRAAGLTDVSVADVQDVVPLVVDYAPVPGLGALLPPVDDPGWAGSQADPTAVIGQLQTIAHQLTAVSPSTGPDLNTAALSAISTVAPASLGVAGVGLPGLGLGADRAGAPGPADDFAPTDVDVDGTLDAAVGEPGVTDPTDAVGTSDGLVGNDLTGGPLGLVDFAGDTLDGTLDQVTGLVGGVTGGLGGVGESVTGLTGTVAGVGDVLDVSPLGTSSGDPALDDLDAGSTVGGLTDQVGETLHGTTSGLLGDNGLTGDDDASTSGGLLGITDNLL